MQRSVRALLAGVVFLVAADAAAQVRPQVAPLVTSTACRDYQNFTPDKRWPGITKADKPKAADDNAKMIAGCLVELNTAVQAFEQQTAPKSPQSDTRLDAIATAKPNDDATLQDHRDAGVDAAKAATEQAPPSDTAEEVVHISLVKAYLAFRNLQRWKQLVEDYGTSRTDVVTEFYALAEQLHGVLSKHGLTQPFAASLVTAFALNAAGATSGGKIGSASAAPPATSSGATDSASTAAAAGFVTWESIHFYASPDRAFDINLAGTFGFQPVFGLVQPAAGQPAAAADITATFQSGFVWSVAAQPNWRFADLAELTGLLRLGQTILNSTNTLTENGTTGIVQVAAQGSGRAELFEEVGVRVSIYGQSLEVLHLKRGLLSPMFAFGAGFRRDSRFSPSGALAGLESPDQRIFLRFQIDGLQLANKDQADKPFTIGFSVDFDGPLHRTGNYVPSGTRMMIRGDLNLFKAAQSQK